MQLRRVIPLVAVMIVGGRAPLSAQVGHSPSNSPYRDLEYRHEATVFSGYFKAARDRVGVAPQGGPLVGLRYDFRLGGPAYLTGEVSGVQTERTIIDPRLPAATRVVGSETGVLMLVDFGIAVNLTGFKSYHGLVPVVNTGLGFATDFKARGDIGTYRFGTPFLLSLGGGVKWTAKERLQLRFDLTDHFYQIKYPGLYYQEASDGSSVLDLKQSRSQWQGNYAFTIGASYLLFR